ncbi:hypothetical protein Tco_1418495 [Tanacetum coccineum]
MPAQSDPLGHLREELRTLSTKVDQLESNISKKNSLPMILKDSIKESVEASIEEKPPLFVAHVCYTAKGAEESYQEQDGKVRQRKATKVFKKANAEGEKWEKNNLEQQEKDDA